MAAQKTLDRGGWFWLTLWESGLGGIVEMPFVSNKEALNTKHNFLKNECMVGETITNYTKEDRMEDLKALGKSPKQPNSPEEAELERVLNPHRDCNFLARFTQPEFTSLCPVTAQPDFAHLVIDYIPDQWMVESKSLKLYLGSFRNHQAFHEACTVDIAKELISLLSPRWLRIGGYWYPRGGIPIDVFWQHGTIPEGAWVPDQGVAGYRGRG